MQKVRLFNASREDELEDKINEFARYHHIENISYTISHGKYGDIHKYLCCVLYTE